MNPKKFLHNSTLSIQVPYIASHSLKNNYKHSIVNKTEGEGQLYATLLLQLCDLEASLVLILCTSMIRLKELSLCHKL